VYKRQPLTQREKDLIAADERLLMMITENTPDVIRTYLDVETTMPRVTVLSEAPELEVEEVNPTVEVQMDADDQEEDVQDVQDAQAMPESEEEDGVPGDGCLPGFKRPRGDPTGPCEEARKPKLPGYLRDNYVGVPKSKKPKTK
jgi:hypothetical protein